MVPAEAQPQQPYQINEGCNSMNAPHRETSMLSKIPATRFLRVVIFGVWSVGLITGAAYAQSKSNPPDLSGAWSPYRGGRGADPKLAPPPATPIVLKPEYAKAYEARRAVEAEAARRNEPLASAAVSCVPYGMPSMMSVVSYPVEITQTP